jgi:hypothetical protein
VAGVEKITFQVPVEHPSANGNITTVQIVEDVVIQKQYVNHRSKLKVNQKQECQITQFSF